MGYISANYVEEIIPTIWNDNLFLFSLAFIVLFIIFILAYLIHIILHEFGHLIFGLATGYSFVSFRIGSFTLIKENGKFKLKRYGIPGTAGQCLMMPPDLRDGKYPFVIYNFGGVIVNALTSLISILIIAYINNPSSATELFLILFTAAGIIVVLTNGIPLKISGITNDGHNVLSISRDKGARQGFYLQLRVNGLLSQGMRYKELDKTLFELEEGSDMSNPVNTSLKMMEYEWHLDNLDFDSARSCLQSLVPYLKDIIPLYVNEINCERIFLELIGDCDKKLIDRLYNSNLKKYIKAAKFMMNKPRTLMAYEAFYNQDKEKALDRYKELRYLYDNYPVKGEADMELMLADWIKEVSNWD